MAKRIAPPAAGTRAMAALMSGGMTLLTARQVADATGYQPQSVRANARRGYLVGARLDRRGQWLVPSIYADRTTYDQAIAAQARPIQPEPQAAQVKPRTARRAYDAGYLTGMGWDRQKVAQELCVSTRTLSNLRKQHFGIWGRGMRDARNRVEAIFSSIPAVAQGAAKVPPPQAVSDHGSLFREQPFVAALIAKLAESELLAKGTAGSPSASPAQARLHMAADRYRQMMTLDDAGLFDSLEAKLSELVERTRRQCRNLGAD